MHWLGEIDQDTTIWRYLTMSKFESLARTRSVWFSKLRVFEDSEEGRIPEPARGRLKAQQRAMEDWFADDERRRQVRRFADDNEEDGRELIVASCWFVGERESKQMWAAYAGNDEGVAIQSTVGDLVRSLTMSHGQWWAGRMKYIDLKRHEEMDAYEGWQAHLRAFLKSDSYAHENEFRVATMNWVAPGCLNPDGSPRTAQQRAGLVYSTGRAGILVQTHLPTLVRALRTAPGASDRSRVEVGRLSSVSGITVPVETSDAR